MNAVNPETAKPVVEEKASLIVESENQSIGLDEKKADAPRAIEPPEPSQKSKTSKLAITSLVVALISLVFTVISNSYNLGFIRQREDHDVVARVVKATFVTKGFSVTDTNGELYVELAVINRGNQTEIIRDAFLCYSGSQSFVERSRSLNDQPLNLQLAKGEKRVLRLSAARGSIFGQGKVWLGVGIRSIAPNADDIECVWPVAQVEIAADGNGGGMSHNESPMVQVISNKRMIHQKAAPNWP